MTNPVTVRIDHCDNELDIMDKINEGLAKFGIVLVDDGEEHDGFMLLEVRRLDVWHW